MSDIKLTIGADIKELEQKLSVAKTKVEGFDKSSTAAAGSFRKFGDVLPDVGKKASSMGDGLRGAADAAQQAGADLGDMSGILQGGLIALIPVAVAGLQALGDALFGASQQEKDFNEVLQGSAKGFTEAYSAIESLRAQSELLAQGFGDGEAFLKQYNETLGKTIGKTDSLAQAEQNLAAYGETYIRVMFAQAFATLAFQKAAESAFKSLLIPTDKGGFVGGALKQLAGEADKATDRYKQLGRTATQVLEYLKTQLPKIVAGDDIDIETKVKPKFVKPKKQDVEDFKYKYKASLADSITSENTKEPFEPEIVIKPTLKFLPPELDKRVEELNAMVTEIFANGLANLGDNIGKALTGKAGVGDLFSGLFQSLGAGLKQLGQYFIKTALEVKLFKEFITKNPILAAVAGFALTALGSVIQSATAKKNAFATGTRNFSGGTALVGERGPELLTLPTGASITPNAQLNAMGGREVFIAETAIRGTDLVTVFNRATALNSRNS